jgi:hypothetical protein
MKAASKSVDYPGRSLTMGSRDLDPMIKKARPILNERDYQGAKALLDREMKHTHSEKVWERLEALMQEVADYEARFIQGEDDDPTPWVQYAYQAALDDDDEAPQRRWTDSEF